jgi:Domain of unknown function (DUF3387)
MERRSQPVNATPGGLDGLDSSLSRASAGVAQPRVCRGRRFNSEATFIREALRRGEESGLSVDEVAFYDALADNLSARAVMSDSDLRTIACEVARVRAKATIGHNASAFARTCVDRCGGSWRSTGILLTRKSQQRNS